MSKVSDKGYVQLFYMLIKFKSDMNIFQPSKEDVDFATNLTFLVNYFKGDIFDAEYEYDFKENKVVSKHIQNFFMFINVDYDGVINELASQSETHFDEVTSVYFIEELLKSFNIMDKEEVNSLATTLFFQKKYNVNKYGDCKKCLTKDKLHTEVNLELLKETFKRLTKDLKTSDYLK